MRLDGNIVTIRNANGHALHCMLDLPAPGSSVGMACVLVSPGVKMRVAPHRLYSKLAKSFVERGIAVLRIDLDGLGDSEGDLSEVRLDQLYRQVQQGRHIGDVVAALDYLEKNHKISRVIAGGLCGGALTALLAADRDSRIHSLYAIGLPVILDGGGEHASKTMTTGQMGSMRSRYIKKLLKPGAWLRLLTFKSDFRMLASVLLRKLWAPGSRASGVALPDLPIPAVPPAANLNMQFVRAYFSMLMRRQPILMIFSGSDRLYWEYDEKFVAPWKASLDPIRDVESLHVIEGANHILSDPIWVGKATELTASWLESRILKSTGGAFATG